MITGIKPIVQMKDFKNILNGNVASRIEVINGIKMFVMYEPFKVGTHMGHSSNRALLSISTSVKLIPHEIVIREY